MTPSATDLIKDALPVLTDAQSAAGAHGPAWLSPVLGDGGDAD